MFKPPDFPVGPEMSGAILEIITKHPTISHIEVAERLGAEPGHPFFLTDLAVARAWSSGESVPSHRIDHLEREQWLNVRLAIAMMAAAVAATDWQGLEIVLPVIERMEEAHLSSEHVVLAIQLGKLAETIVDAGQIDGPIETTLRECLEADPHILSKGGDVRSETVKKVLSRSSTKDGSQRTIELPVDLDTDSKKKIEAEGEGSSDARTGTQRQTTQPHQRDERRPAT